MFLVPEKNARSQVSEVSINFLTRDIKFCLFIQRQSLERYLENFRKLCLAFTYEFYFLFNRVKLISKELRTRSERVGRNQSGDEKRWVGRLSSDSNICTFKLTIFKLFSFQPKIYYLHKCRKNISKIKKIDSSSKIHKFSFCFLRKLLKNFILYFRISDEQNFLRIRSIS